MTKHLDKRLTLGILAQAVDIARQAIWAGAANKKIGKTEAEHLLVNFDAAMQYSHAMLHDVLTGKTAQWIQEIDEKAETILIGHQANATYIRISWDDIREMSADIEKVAQEKKLKNKQTIETPKV